MAVISAAHLAQARNEMERGGGAIAYTKPQINAGLQAIEDAMTTTPIPAGAVGATMPQYISNRIDAATAPFTFSGPAKMRLFAMWAFLKFERDKAGS